MGGSALAILDVVARNAKTLSNSKLAALTRINCDMHELTNFLSLIQTITLLNIQTRLWKIVYANDILQVE
jgi:hypothetical protein